MKSTLKRTGLCIECQRPKEAHGPGGMCPRYVTMELPEGKTCSNCVHVTRCTSIFGQSAEDESCQFFPIRYREMLGARS